MSRRDSARSTGGPKEGEDREQRLAALRIRLQEAAQAVRTPEDWTRCLSAAARLPAEPWANVLLISSRRPDATLVMGYEAWRAVGRQVNRDEKGIAIFSAGSRQKRTRHVHGDEEQDLSWRNADHITYVWDLSQTSGQPLPTWPAAPSRPAGALPGLWDALCWLARREGYAVERQPGCPDDGTTLHAARRVRVPLGLTTGEAIWALAHQLGHILLHDTPTQMPRASTTGCEGMRKAEADSVAFITCARHGSSLEHTFASPQTWAGTDPRAQPAAAILAAGQRITTAAATISRYLDHHLLSDTTGLPAPTQARTIALPAIATAPASSPEPDASVDHLLFDAEQFYVGQLTSSWVPAYLEMRGITPTAIGEWHIGYAPYGWTPLTSHLRGRGHHDDVIRAAGLAHVSSRGTLIDHFRDRVMLPVHDEHGNLAGFIGRARPGTDRNVPKYLNGPATIAYQKGDLLFGLHHARGHLARGAVPVIVEGPFDAIAVTLADPDQYAGLAPCGTALTSRQAAALSRAADLHQAGVLIAFDDDPAGRKAAVRAYDILRPISICLQSVTLSGKDPAEILQTEGPVPLRTMLRECVRPLSAIVIDAHIDPWERRLHDPEGPLLAMRSTATLIASLLPPEAAEAIRQITQNKELLTFDERLHPVTNPQLPEIARALPADTTYQIIRAAERLGFTDYSDALIEVANAVTRKTARPKVSNHTPAPRLARDDFPHLSITMQPSTEAAPTAISAPGRRQKVRQTKRLPFC